MGTELASAFERLADLIASRQVPGASTSRGESGAIVVASPDQAQKLELMASDVKLNGVGNYLSWSRRALLILKGKGLMGYVLGDVEEPADKKTAEWKQWSTTDSLIFAWLLNSLTPAIAASVEALPNTLEVWKLLSKRYSGKGNLMLMSQIQDKIRDVHQGDRSVMDYVNELQHLWANLDQCDPLVLPDAESTELARTCVERRRVLDFLKGLNPGFESRRATLLHQPTLVSFDEAIAAISQEEVRLQSKKGGGNESAFRMTEQRQWESAGRENRDCFNCGRTGHLSCHCTAPPARRGRGRGYTTSNNNRGGSNSNYSRGGSSNNSTRGGRSGSSGSSYAPRANVVTSGDEEYPTEGREATTSYTNFVYTNEGNTEHASIAAHATTSEWILDSGASKHVAGDFSEFSSYIPHSPTHQGTIHTADGTAQPIKGVGTVSCTPIIELSSVLHVPAFT